MRFQDFWRGSHQRERDRGRDQWREQYRNRQEGQDYGGKDYETQDEDFERRGWRSGGDYYSTRSEQPSFNDRWEDAYGRERREPPGASFRGRGPRGYRRSDDRIREDVCECLTADDWIDASNIEVTVMNCEVTLTGTVGSRDQKRRAENVSERVSGVKDVNNSLHVVDENQGSATEGRQSASAMQSGQTTEQSSKQKKG